MRRGWALSTLGSVCQIKPSKSEAKRALSEADLVSFVPMNDLGEETKSLRLSTERPLGEVVGSYTYFADGDVLLAKITPCFENGKLGVARNLTNGIGFGSSEFIVFRSKGDIEPDYLYYFLSQDSFRQAGAKVMTGAVGHKRVPKEFIEDHAIPVPPLPEQKRIVAILDEAFLGIATAVANAEKNLANARELFESYLNMIFAEKGRGWASYPLERLIEADSKITYGVVKPGPEGEVPFVRGGDIADGRIKIDKLRTITREVSNQYRRTLLLGGEILMCLVGVPGQTAVAPSELVGANIARQVGLVRLRREINPYFASLFLRSRIGLEGLGAYTGGSVQQVINLRDLKQVRVPLPDRAIQDEYVAKLEEIEKYSAQLTENCRRKLADLVELKQSLLHKAFAGELTANAVDEGVA